jgi:hypothetical protein
MLRTMRLAGRRVLPLACLLVGIGVLGVRGAAAQASDEARQACTGDAMRLCSEFVPDVPKITSCMMRKRAQLSRECRVAMAHEHMRYRRAGRVACRYHHCS